MRLFQALYRKKMPNGHIFRGKVRLTKPVTVLDSVKLRNEFEVQEQNMFYLRHAYLTPKQSVGHSAAFGNCDDKYARLLQAKKKDFKDNLTVEYMLGHLRHKEAWD